MRVSVLCHTEADSSHFEGHIPNWWRSAASAGTISPVNTAAIGSSSVHPRRCQGHDAVLSSRTNAFAFMCTCQRDAAIHRRPVTKCGWPHRRQQGTLAGNHQV